jgi:hypothetical protein
MKSLRRYSRIQCAVRTKYLFAESELTPGLSGDVFEPLFAAFVFKHSRESEELKSLIGLQTIGLDFRNS